MEDLLQGYNSIVELPVAWGDMDAALHVNNTIYLRYSESGRIAYLSALNFQVDVNNEANPVGPILAEIHCKYKAPLTYPDTVSVATRVNLNSMDEFSFIAEQIIVSHKLKRVVAEVQAKLVSYDYQALKKAPLPKDFRQRVLEIG